MSTKGDSNRTKKTARSLQSVLGGGFLANKRTAENVPFLLFLAFLGLIYIGNSYYAEKKIRKIEHLQKEVKELRYNFIYTRSQLMSKSRQSEIAKTLSYEGLKESRTPPKKIISEK